MQNGDIISHNELAVLKCLETRSVISRERPNTDIGEISLTTGIRDNDEVLRALYTLEGRSLVEPHPTGDFTSNYWQITSVGQKALRIMAG